MFWRTEIHRGISWNDLEARQAEILRNLGRGEAVLLFSEPQPTFTCGRTGKPTDLLWSDEQLRKRGVTVAKVSRGGKWTYHGPGQVVLYPLIHLADLSLPSKGSRVFVDTFRRSILSALHGLGVGGYCGDEPYGIYVCDKKVVSFGLHFQNGIASHGAALYLKNQSKYFSGINPCGAPQVPLTSLENLGHFLTWGDTVSQLAEHVKNGFQLLAKPLI